MEGMKERRMEWNGMDSRNIIGRGLDVLDVHSTCILYQPDRMDKWKKGLLSLTTPATIDELQPPGPDKTLDCILFLRRLVSPPPLKECLLHIAKFAGACWVVKQA